MGKLTQEMLEDSLIDSNELMQVSNCGIIFCVLLISNELHIIFRYCRNITLSRIKM